MDEKANIQKVIFNEVKKYKLYIFTSFILILITQGLVLIPPRIMSRIIDIYIPREQVKNVYLSILLLSGIPLCTALMNALFNYYVYVNVKKFSLHMKKKIFLNIIKQPISFFDDSNVGELCDYCNKDVTDFMFFWLMDIPNLFANIVVAIILFYLMAHLDFKITLFQLIAIPIILVPSKHFGQKVNTYGKKVVRYNAQSNSIMNETFSGIKTVKIFQLENKRGDVLENLSKKAIPIFGKIAFLDRLYGDWAQKLVALIFIGCSFAFGSLGVIKGNLSLGSLIVFLAYIPMFYQNITNISSANLQFNKKMADYEKTFELLVKENEFIESKLSEKHNNFIDGSVLFENVSFSYKSSGKEVLTDINFNVNDGEYVGLVGPSGSGKSTIFKLLVGFYKEYEGNIYVGQQELRTVPIEYIRKNITLASQDPFLFSGTLRENLLLANEEATESELLEVIEITNLTNLIKSLPDGLDTYIGENGAKLSGGEKQRVFLAMALLRGSKIILLDEITSNVDIETEKLIRDAIMNLVKIKNITVIAISHRETLLESTSKIIKINEGRIYKTKSNLELNS